MTTHSVVVTGAGAGIGRAIVEHLLNEGFYVVGLERDGSAAADLEASLDGGGTVVVGDVCARDVMQRAVDVATHIAPLSGWVNNAGIPSGSPLLGHPQDLLKQVLAVNLEGTFWGCEAAVRTFCQQGSTGAIVNISSIHGRRAFPKSVAYDISKAGIDALTRNVAIAYAPQGIRANAVAPGGVLTPHMQRSLAASPDPEATRAELVASTPLGRLADASEIASVVAFLLSEASSYITGQSLGVDGGWSVAGPRAQATTDVQGESSSTK